MPPRRNKEKFQQLTEFERRSNFGFREGGFFLSRNGSSCVAEQIYIDASSEAVDQRTIENLAVDDGSYRYLREVLQPEVVPFFKGIPGAIFQQDNACLHVAKTVRDFCSAHHMQLLSWPVYSPAMSSIEHVWDLVGR
ncbi:hypothetical protein TNCV_3368131 [Trichonephila clavipes]|nr:hypothetical protein TNCV_3368131 [Trichonephila clavipes]